MGNSPAAAAHPQTARCQELQTNLQQQEGTDEENFIPRSTKVDGRFILSKEHFPDYIDYGSLSDLYKWRSEAEPLESYTTEFLNQNLPVLIPDKGILTRGSIDDNLRSFLI
jgi:hypothetical protein